MLKLLRNKSAFTLVELSIVIAIIGLLFGATYAGVALVESSEVKTTIAEVQRLNEAIGQFQGLYKYMPGDFPKASSFWSSESNGDGNGQIAAETSNEPFMALRHLYLAGVLEGAYAGFSGTWGTGFVASTSSVTGNVIGSKGRKSAIIYLKCCSGTDYSRTISFNNHISVASIHSTSTKRAGVFSPIEAYEIDKKIDDGVPDTGLVGASAGWNGTAYPSPPSDTATSATGCYTLVTGPPATSKYDTAVAANKNLLNCQMQFAYDWN